MKHSNPEIRLKKKRLLDEKIKLSVTVSQAKDKVKAKAVCLQQQAEEITGMRAQVKEYLTCKSTPALLQVVQLEPKKEMPRSQEPPESK